MDDRREATTISYWRRRFDRQATATDDPLAVSGWARTAGAAAPLVVRQMLDDVVETLELGGGERLLDVGAGNGLFLREIAPLVRSAVGVDYSLAMLRRTEPNANVRWAGGEAGQLPFASGSFDRVLTLGVFHVLPSHAYAERAISEMRRVCRPGGRILVADVAPPDAPLPVGSPPRRLLARAHNAFLGTPWARAGLARLPGGPAYLTRRVIFYRRSFFQRAGDRLGLEVAFLEPRIPARAPSPRYHVLLRVP